MDVSTMPINENLQRKYEDMYPNETPREAANIMTRRFLASAERTVKDLENIHGLDDVEQMILSDSKKALETKIHKHVKYDEMDPRELYRWSSHKITAESDM